MSGWWLAILGCCLAGGCADNAPEKPLTERVPEATEGQDGDEQGANPEKDPNSSDSSSDSDAATAFAEGGTAPNTPSAADGSSEPANPDPATPTPAPGKLVHPGILSSATDLAFIKAQVDAKKEPWASALRDLVSSEYAAADYKATPFKRVECGSYNKPNVGCTPFVEDGAAVYAHALLWSLTGEKSHAQKAIEIIDAWSAVYEGNTESNARLTVAWAAPWYANGAEILRYSGAGWSEASMAQFSGMLKKMLPYVKDNERPENNWMQSRIEAHMAIAVFLDDPAELAAAIERFRFWLPIYLYQKSDGATPVNPPGRTTAQTAGIWDSGSYVDGLAMETCRDLGHLGLGFRSMMYAAETAWQQGTDLFAPHSKRLSDFMELHGSWMMGKVSVPGSICGGVVRERQGDTTGIKPPQGGGSQVWEIGYHHLHERLGMNLPMTLAMIQGGRPTGGGMWVAKWETLTHGNRPVRPD